MVWGDRKFVGALVAVAVVSVSVLTGCAPEAPTKSNVAGEFPDVTLAETKSPVQFLRNDAASRIPTAVIDKVEGTVDQSVACFDEAKDPDGLIRSWRSSALVTIVSGSAWRVEAIVDNLIQSFTDQEWSARSLGETADFRSSMLTSKTSMAEIQVIGERPNPDQTKDSEASKAEQVTVEIQVHGPCVRTKGSGSEEVLLLETP
ncbi:MAG: hypothetical protein ACOH1T_10095 [Microbacteriaceae bacterium]